MNALKHFREKECNDFPVTNNAQSIRFKSTCQVEKASLKNLNFKLITEFNSKVAEWAELITTKDTVIQTKARSMSLLLQENLDLKSLVQQNKV